MKTVLFFSQRSLGPALDREGKNKGKGLRGRKRTRADSEVIPYGFRVNLSVIYLQFPFQDGDSNMLVRLEDVGNSSDEFVQVLQRIALETVQFPL